MRSWPDVSTGRRTRPSFWTSLQDAVDEIEGGEVSLPLAGIEGALGTYGPLVNMRAGVANVLDDGADPTGVADSTAAFEAAWTAGKIAYAPRGTYLVNTDQFQLGILGDGIDKTIIRSNPGADADVIQGASFLDLTGKTKESGDVLRGARRTILRSLTIDGDKANNASGYGVRIWGCGHKWQNLKVINGKDGNIWTEFTTHDAGTINDDLESFFTNIHSIGSDGDGWAFRGPHDSHISNYVAFGNAGWAFYASSASGSYNGTLGMAGRWNSWLNGHSFYFGPGVAHGSNLTATGGDTGTGIEFGATSGASLLTGVAIAGHDAGLIMRGLNNSFSGMVTRCGLGGSGDAGIVWDSPSGCMVDVIGTGNKLAVRVNADAVGPSILRGLFNVSTGSGHSLKSGSAFHAQSDIHLQQMGSVYDVISQRVAPVQVAGYHDTAFSVKAPGYDPHFVVDNIERSVKVRDGGLLKVGAAWNSGRVVMGSYHLWIDSSGRLRIKSSAPSSDTDGTIVGLQS